MNKSKILNMLSISLIVMGFSFIFICIYYLTQAENIIEKVISIVEIFIFLMIFALGLILLGEDNK